MNTMAHECTHASIPTILTFVMLSLFYCELKSGRKHRQARATKSINRNKSIKSEVNAITSLCGFFKESYGFSLGKAVRLR